jgi:hypothetical protein
MRLRDIELQVSQANAKIEAQKSKTEAKRDELKKLRQ